MHSSSSDSFSSAPLPEDGESQHYQRHHPQTDQGTRWPSARLCWVESRRNRHLLRRKILVLLPLLMERSLLLMYQ